MTDKEQIIIDSVDVSGCVFYQIKANKLHPKAQYCGSMRNIFCEDEPNCYFKQLARKTQECEEIKEEYEALKLENKELYRILADLKEERKLKDKYKQECEELKKDLQDYESWFDEYKILFTYDGRTPVTNDELYTCLEELAKKGNDETNRYRKALEEIAGLVKNFCKDCGDYENCNWDKEGCYYSLIPNLKDIINKARGEE